MKVFLIKDKHIFLMKSKVIQNSFIILFFIIFSYFYWEDFFNYQKDKTLLEEIQEDVINEANRFSLEDLKSENNSIIKKY